MSLLPGFGDNRDQGIEGSRDRGIKGSRDRGIKGSRCPPSRPPEGGTPTALPLEYRLQPVPAHRVVHWEERSDEAIPPYRPLSRVTSAAPARSFDKLRTCLR